MIALAAAMLAGAIVLAMGLALAALLRRRSAALRHAILAAAVVTALVMPIGKLVLPQLPVIHWTESSAVVSSHLSLRSDAIAVATDESAITSRHIPWPVAIGVVWLAGAILIGAGLVTSLVRLSRIRRRCAPADERWRHLADAIARERGLRRRIALLQSSDPSLLVTCGMTRPAIILPDGAPAWPDDRRRTVLQHELAHIARHDAAIQIAGEVLRVLQWINPLVWIACRSLRHESEFACDDAVLSAGVDPTHYARHLLAVAKHVSARDAAWASAPGIAHPSTLERRIVAMLNHQQDRTPLTRRGRTAVVVVAVALSAPIAAAGIAPSQEPAVRPHAADVVLSAPAPAPMRAPHTAPVAVRVMQARASLDGTVLDQLGGTLPGVTVNIDNANAGIAIVVRTAADGTFTAHNIPAGQYELRAALPGFMTLSTLVSLTAGDTLEQRLTLPIGTVSETVVVACSASPQIAKLQRLMTRIGDGLFPVVFAQEQGTPPRVGGNVRIPLKLTDVKPVCPSTLPGGETHVRLSGHIGTDGRITDAALADGAAAPPADLVDRAIDAVRQWTFRPTLLDDQPIAIPITVEVVFKS